MPLRKNVALIEQYEQKLIDNSIADDELDILLAEDTFTQSPGYPNPFKKLTDINHSRLDAIQDFVLAIVPQLTPETLHSLTQRLIERAPNAETNGLFRSSSLGKSFLTYEMAHHPDLAEQHFQLEKITSQLASEQDLEMLKSRILAPGIEFFKNPNRRIYTPTVLNFAITTEGTNNLSLTPSTSTVKKNILKDLFSPDPYGLRKFIQHYSIAIPLETATGDNQMRDGECRASKKLAMGIAMHEHIKEHGIANIERCYQENLIKRNLTNDDFFSGKTERYLTPQFVQLLKASRPLTVEL